MATLSSLLSIRSSKVRTLAQAIAPILIVSGQIISLPSVFIYSKGVEIAITRSIPIYTLPSCFDLIFAFASVSTISFWSGLFMHDSSRVRQIFCFLTMFLVSGYFSSQFCSKIVPWLTLETLFCFTCALFFFLGPRHIFVNRINAKRFPSFDEMSFAFLPSLLAVPFVVPLNLGISNCFPLGLPFIHFVARSKTAMLLSLFAVIFSSLLVVRSNESLRPKASIAMSLITNIPLLFAITLALLLLLLEFLFCTIVGIGNTQWFLLNFSPRFVFVDHANMSSTANSILTQAASSGLSLVTTVFLITAAATVGIISKDSIGKAPNKSK